MEKFKAFLKRKDIEISLKRYGIDALGAMAQGLFCSLLIGTIINTVGTQFHIPFLTANVATVAGTDYTVQGGNARRADREPVPRQQGRRRASQRPGVQEGPRRTDCQGNSGIRRKVPRNAGG